MIEASHLSHQFGTVRAVDDVSFSIPRGQIAGFLGPNGAGKTTMMRILAGIFPPTSGRARIAGFDTQDAPLAARRRVGYFAESAPYHPELTVWSYLGYVAHLKGLHGAERPGAVDAVIERCDLQAVADCRIGVLSRGYRQRVGLAQALLGDPGVLILDEPTVGLDPEQAAGIRDWIAAMRGERTVLLSSHNLSEVQSLCERLIVVRAGRLVADDTVEHLAEHSPARLHARLRVEAPTDVAVRVVMAVPGVTLATADAGGRIRIEASTDKALREVALAIQGQGWLLLELARETPPFDDVVLSLLTPGREPPR